MVTQAELSAAACEYAANGWRVFPCKPGEKTPATKTGFNAATDEVSRVRAWWRQQPFNIGLWTGASGLLVVDCDVPHVADRCPEGVCTHNGISQWFEMMTLYNLGSVATRASMTPRYGMHFFFDVSDDGHEYPPAVAVKGRPQIDIRASGSYVVLPPSEVTVEATPAGEWTDAVLEQRQYEWVDNSPIMKLPKLLQAQFRKWPKPQRTYTVEKVYAPDGIMPEWYVEAIHQAVELIHASHAGNRNIMIGGEAMSLFRRMEKNPEFGRQAYDRLHSAALTVADSPREARKPLDSAFRKVYGYDY